MKYESRDLEKAKAGSLPLFKVEVDFRYAKEQGKGTKQVQNWGACTPEMADALLNIIRQKA